MKCPKCGYKSFEFLDTCKKCGAEVVSFKKNHRISPVILTPGAARNEASVEPVISAAAVPPVVPGTGAESAGDEFSWETPGESATTKREENPYSGFDLGFQDSVDAGTQDKAFTGFTFSDEPADPHPAQASAPGGGLHDGFSFEETTGEEPETSPLEMKFDEPDSGMERYEKLLELDSVGGTDALAGGVEDTGSSLAGDFDADDFSFAPEPVVEDVFQLEEETATAEPTENKPRPDEADFDKEAVEDIFQLKEDTVTAAPAEKKPQPNLADFDKEFEQIFSFGDTGEEDPKS